MYCRMWDWEYSFNRYIQASLHLCEVYRDCKIGGFMLVKSNEIKPHFSFLKRLELSSNRMQFFLKQILSAILK